jgi:hypothetical protein
VRRAREEGNWWDREASAEEDAGAVRMTIGRQAEMFDAAGHVALQPAVRVAPPAAEPPVAPLALPMPKTVPQTIVSVQSKSRTTARVVATTRVAVATRVASVAKTATAARGAVARQLVRSQSISSGSEESRWFSVPQRVLLPRYQLFEGAAAVTEDGGSLCIGSPSTRAQHGRVWFV